MKDGYVKAAAASIAVKVGDCEHNGAKIVKRIKEAAQRGAKLLVLPELCVTGATCGDLFYQKTLLDYALKCVWKLAEATLTCEIPVVVGAPAERAGKLYDCAFVLYGGDVLGVVPRRRVGGVLGRWFADCDVAEGEIELGAKTRAFGTDLIFECDDLPAFKLGVEVGARQEGDFGYVTRLCQKGARIVANPFVLPERTTLAEELADGWKALTRGALCAIVAAGGGDESTGDAAYGGRTAIVECGAILTAGDAFDERMSSNDIDLEAVAVLRRRAACYPAEREGMRVGFDMQIVPTALEREISSSPFLPTDEGARRIACARMLQTQARGLARRVAHVNAAKLIVGVSGGLDSALAMIVGALALDALDRPRKDMIAITMPCFGTTGRTRHNAEILSAGLRAAFVEIPIAEAVRGHLSDIGQPEGLTDAAYENAQARERTQILMDYANRTGGLVVGTGDMSELALGWATYNGDHMSMYGVNAGVPKTVVRALTAFYADLCGDEVLADALRDIIDTPVSPELLPAQDDRIVQQTEDLVGPYELHDFFLYYTLAYGFAPKKLLRMALRAFDGKYGRDVVLAWMEVFFRRFFSQQFKRSCMPDGVAVGALSLSPRGGLSMPSDACANLWLKEIERMRKSGDKN